MSNLFLFFFYLLYLKIIQNITRYRYSSYKFLIFIILNKNIFNK